MQRRLLVPFLCDVHNAFALQRFPPELLSDTGSISQGAWDTFTHKTHHTRLEAPFQQQQTVAFRGDAPSLVLPTFNRRRATVGNILSWVRTQKFKACGSRVNTQRRRGHAAVPPAQPDDLPTYLLLLFPVLRPGGCMHEERIHRGIHHFPRVGCSYVVVQTIPRFEEQMTPCFCALNPERDTCPEVCSAGTCHSSTFFGNTRLLYLSHYRALPNATRFSCAHLRVADRQRFGFW